MFTQCQSALNQLMFFLRNCKPIFSRRTDDLLHMYMLNEPPTEHERELLDRYQIDSLPVIHDYDYTLNLYHLDLLDQTIPIEALAKLPTVKAIDVGSKNFYYAPVLERFLACFGTLERLEGIEIDAYRRYQDLRTRYDYAQAYLSHIPEAAFHPMDFLQYRTRANVITMFLPFVFERPLLKWGLPLKHFKPEMLMKHAWSLLEEGGIWVITNQGIEEYQVQQEILQRLGIPYEPIGKVESEFYPFSIHQYVTLIKKEITNEQ